MHLYIKKKNNKWIRTFHTLNSLSVNIRESLNCVDGARTVVVCVISGEAVPAVVYLVEQVLRPLENDLTSGLRNRE